VSPLTMSSIRSSSCYLLEHWLTVAQLTVLTRRSQVVDFGNMKVPSVFSQSYRERSKRRDRPKLLECIAKFGARRGPDGTPTKGERRGGEEDQSPCYTELRREGPRWPATSSIGPDIQKFTRHRHCAAMWSAIPFGDGGVAAGPRQRTV
jgi:hypothetical protein